MRAWMAALAAGLLALAAPAKAEILDVGDEGFRIVHAAELPLSAGEAWARLIAVGAWWSDAHTYSGAAANMTLEPTPGGCFCERWPAGAVEHGRVTLAMPGAVLRLNAPLGPLQERPVVSVLTFEVEVREGGSRVRMTFVAAGPPSAGLRELAPLVDRVLGEQMARFADVR